MRYIYKFSFVGGLLFWLSAIVVLPSFSLGLADLYNEKRIAEGIALLLGSISFLYLLNTQKLNVSKQAGYLFLGAFILIAISIFLSPRPGWAIVEIGWYLCLLQLSLLAGYVYQTYPQRFEHVLLAAVIGMAAIYSIQVAGDLITGYVDPNWPHWPDHTRSTIIFNGENIAKNGFLGFKNVRFLNHLQTWSLPILIYSYLRYYASLNNGLKTLLGILITFWWMLVFASGARGTLLATIISVVIISILFKKESLNWIKVCFWTSVTGLALYFLIFYLILPEGPGKAIARPGSSGRIALWWETWQVIKENPFFGIGPMQMANVQSQNPITSPHNIYLMWIAEWGIPAFLVAGFLGVKGLLLWFSESLKNTSIKKITISILILAGLIHSGVSGLLITPLSQLFFAVLLGWAIGIYWGKRDQNIFVDGKRSFKPLKYAFTVGLVAVNFFVFIQVGSQISYLEENSKKFEDLRRQDSVTIYLDKKWGMFPRFWDQGFIGIENIKNENSK